MCHFIPFLYKLCRFAGQFLCSYSTLPLYALVTQVIHDLNRSISVVCFLLSGFCWWKIVENKKICFPNFLTSIIYFTKFKKQDNISHADPIDLFNSRRYFLLSFFNIHWQNIRLFSFKLVFVHRHHRKFHIILSWHFYPILLVGM